MTPNLWGIIDTSESLLVTMESSPRNIQHELLLTNSPGSPI